MKINVLALMPELAVVLKCVDELIVSNYYKQYQSDLTINRLQGVFAIGLPSSAAYKTDYRMFQPCRPVLAVYKRVILLHNCSKSICLH